MEFDGHLDPDLCKQIIERFEKDSRKHAGRSGKTVQPDVKLSDDLRIDIYPEWNDVTEQLEKSLKDGLERYKDYLDIMMPKNYINFSTFTHRGFQIQKSGYYKWHDDDHTEHDLHQRIVTFIWYLNTKEEEGWTDFHYKKVFPRTGKLVIFPSTWTYIHSGAPTTDKYLITGWCYAKR